MRALTQRILIIVGVLVFCSLILFLIGSSPNPFPDGYEQVKHYSAVQINRSSDTLSVMTYNIGYLSGMTNNLPVERPENLFRTNLRRARELLNQLSPDIIGIQEIDFRASRSLKINQLDSLALGAGYPFTFRSINWNKRYVPFPYWPPLQHFGSTISGQAILSKYPLKKDTTITLVKPLNSSFIYKAFYLDRLAQISSVFIAGREVKVLNVHLEAFNEETRIAQAKTLITLCNDLAAKMPVLLIGDFNSRPAVENASNGAMIELSGIKRMKSAITNEMYLGAPEQFYTFNTDTPYQMIDYILYNPEFIEKTEARIVHEASNISDHLPVLMKFRFRQ